MNQEEINNVIKESEERELRNKEIEAAKSKLEEQAKCLFKKYYIPVLHSNYGTEDPGEFLNTAVTEIFQWKKSCHEFRMAWMKEQSYRTDLSWYYQRIGIIEGLIEAREYDFYHGGSK